MRLHWIIDLQLPSPHRRLGSLILIVKPLCSEGDFFFFYLHRSHRLTFKYLFVFDFFSPNSPESLCRCKGVKIYYILT